MVVSATLAIQTTLLSIRWTIKVASAAALLTVATPTQLSSEREFPHCAEKNHIDDIDIHIGGDDDNDDVVDI
jgi:hypothetical protein